MKKLLTKKTLYTLFAFDRLIPVTLISFASWYFFYTQNLVLIYNDAMSHLNISRMVFDNLQPGLAQLGGVWLPVSHILSLALIWNDWAWHSGFAGSFFSMLSYIVSVWAIFKTVLLITKNHIASLTAGFAFALNLNMLYLQATPMTEPLYVGLFTLSAYFFTCWIVKKRNTQYLLILGLLGFFQVLTRYDGWFVVFIEALLIGAYEIVVQKKTLQETLGKLILFCTPVAFGVALWLAWNTLIFGNPFFFAFGPYSAHAQQTAIDSSGQLLTKKNILLSIWAYTVTVLYNIGHFIAALSVISVILLFFRKKFTLQSKKLAIIILFFFAPIAFNILALYLGFSIVSFPGFNPNAPADAPAWFNVRYGILALPLAAFLVGMFSNWKKIGVTISLIVIIIQTYAMYSGGIVTLIDGQKGSSSFNATSITNAVKTRVKPEDKIIMSIYSFNPVAFKSGIQMNQIIHEGVNKLWNDSLDSPEKYAEWIIMADSNGDLVYARLIEKNKKRFLKYYELAYSGNGASIYQLKNRAHLMQNLTLNQN